MLPKRGLRFLEINQEIQTVIKGVDWDNRESKEKAKVRIAELLQERKRIWEEALREASCKCQDGFGD